MLYEQKLISAKQLHQDLGISKAFSTWIKQNLKRAMLDEGKDFIPQKEESTGGRPTIDYILNRDAALNIIVISGGKNAKECREKVIKAYTDKKTGLLLSPKQIKFLLELVPVMGLFSVQDTVEKKHFELFNNKFEWWDYRAKILGYGTDQLRFEVEKLNRKYKSQRQALLHIDKYELIRTGVIDLFVALGKEPEYASNVANVCKDIAKSMKTPIWNDYNTSIKFPTNHNESLESAIKKDQLKLK